jgi:hypothetical protein
MPFSRSLIPPGLVEIGDLADIGGGALPRLGETEFVLSTGSRYVSPATQALIESVLSDHRTLTDAR